MFIPRSTITLALLAATIGACATPGQNQQSRTDQENGVSSSSPIILTSRYPAGRAKRIDPGSSKLISTKSSRFDVARSDSLFALYVNGVGDESSAFPMEQRRAYDAAVIELLNGLIETAEPVGDGPRSIALQIYFSREGQVEHLYYGLVGIDEESFLRGAEKFCESYRFPMKSAVPFKQCSSLALP